MKANGTWLLALVLAVASLFSGPGMAQTLLGETETETETETESESESESESEREREREEKRWSSLDSLNAGLDEPPEGLRRVTPRAAIRSFLELVEQEEFDAAAHVLNLSDLDSGEQQERGSLLAKQLAEVLKRGEWINVSRLSAREDGAIEDPSDQHGRAGEPRRDIKLASLTADGETYDIRLRRYRVDDEEPIWLISPNSVSSIPLLYEEYGPSLLEEHIPKRYKTSYGGLEVWEWIAIPVFLLAIGLVGWAVHWLVGLLAHWLPSGALRILTGRIRVPTALLVMAFVAQALLDYVISFTAVATTFIRILLIVLIAWGVGTIALRVVDTSLLKVTRRIMGEIDDTKPRDERELLTSLYALRRIVILVTVTAVSVYVMSQIQLFETLGLTLLASASVLAVLIGIAGQAVLGNILSSFQLSLAKPIRIGDLVMFEGQWCYVEGIFYTFIRLRVWDKRRLIVPVTYFVSRPFENLSVKSAKMYRTLELILHLSADIQIIREKFLAFAKEEHSVVEHHNLCTYVTGQTETAQTISCFLVASDPFAGWVAEVNIRERLMAFIRDEHPEWWPRNLVVLSQHDIARGERRDTRPPAETDSIDGPSPP